MLPLIKQIQLEEVLVDFRFSAASFLAKFLFLCSLVERKQARGLRIDGLSTALVQNYEWWLKEKGASWQSSATLIVPAGWMLLSQRASLGQPTYPLFNQWITAHIGSPTVIIKCIIFMSYGHYWIQSDKSKKLQFRSFWMHKILLDFLICSKQKLAIVLVYSPNWSSGRCCCTWFICMFFIICVN